MRCKYHAVDVYQEHENGKETAIHNMRNFEMMVC